MNPIVHYLSQIAGFTDLLLNEDSSGSVPNLNKTECTTLNNQKYKVIRYNKTNLTFDIIPTYGLCRSVIVNSNNQVVCFSPPKSVKSDSFIEKYNIKNDTLIAEEFVEGTMIIWCVGNIHT